MKWVREHCHVIGHPRFLAAGALGRDLWEWGLKYSGLYETDGELPMDAVLTSAWGAGGKANLRVATKLVEVGLWERTEHGFRSLRWAEMGNPTKAEIEESRKIEREGRAQRRKRTASAPVSTPDSSECPARTPGGVPYSLSHSPSGSGSGSREGVQGEITLDSPLPDRWRDDARAQVEPSGQVIDIDEQWRLYLTDRLRPESPKRVSAADWRGWVIRGIGFARKARSRGDPAPRQRLGSAANAPWMTPQPLDFGETK